MPLLRIGPGFVGVQLVEHLENATQLSLGAHVRLRDREEPAVTGGRLCVQFTVGTLEVSGDVDVILEVVGVGFLEEVHQHAGARVDVDDDAALAVEEGLVPVGRVEGGVIGVGESFVDELLLELHGFEPLVGGVAGGELTVALGPPVAGAVPSFDHVVRAVRSDRAGPLRNDEPVGVIDAVAVGILLGECLRDVVQILGRLRCLQPEVGEPVLADDHGGAHDIASPEDAVHLAVDARRLLNLGEGRLQVRVVVEVVGQVPERASLRVANEGGVLALDDHHLRDVVPGKRDVGLVCVRRVGDPVDVEIDTHDVLERRSDLVLGLGAFVTR